MKTAASLRVFRCLKRGDNNSCEIHYGKTIPRSVDFLYHIFISICDS